MRLPGLCCLSDEKEEIAPDRLCYSLKLHPWVTKNGAELLPTEDENCTLVEVTEEEVENSVKHIPSLATVVSTREMMVRGCTAGSVLPPGSVLSSRSLMPKGVGFEQRLPCSWKQVLQDGAQHLTGGGCTSWCGGMFHSGPISELLVSTLELAA